MSELADFLETVSFDEPIVDWENVEVDTEDDDIEEKHLPGRHDQKTHGHLSGDDQFEVSKWKESHVVRQGVDILVLKNPNYNPPKDSAIFYHDTSAMAVESIIKNGIDYSKADRSGSQFNMGGGGNWFNKGNRWPLPIEVGSPASGATIIVSIPTADISKVTDAGLVMGWVAEKTIPPEWIKEIRLNQPDSPESRAAYAASLPSESKHLPGHHDQLSHAGERGSQRVEGWQNDEEEKVFRSLRAEKDDQDSRLESLQRNALEQYVSSGYRDINGYLRHGESGIVDEPNVSSLNRVINWLDSAFHKKAAKLDRDVFVFRGMTGSSFNKLKEGDVIIDKGYVSTSLSRVTALAGFADLPGKVFAEIRLPKGQKYLIGGIGEYEYVLPRGTKFKVITKSETHPTKLAPVPTEAVPMWAEGGVRHLVLEVVND